MIYVYIYTVYTTIILIFVIDSLKKKKVSSKSNSYIPTYVAYGETSALKLDFKKDNERLKKIHTRF